MALHSCRVACARIARLLYFKGMETAGISANASIFATYPLYTSIIAILLLGEALTAENWIGLACIMAGVFGWKKHTRRSSLKRSKKGFTVRCLGLGYRGFADREKEGLNIYNRPPSGVAGEHHRLSSTSSNWILQERGSFKVFAPRHTPVRKRGVGIAAGWLLSFLDLAKRWLQ